MKTYFLTALTAALLPLGAAVAAEFPQPASLKRTEVNVRAGPGTRYPILWVFQRAGWPVLLLTKYDNWYKIRDVEGEEGWVYLGMVRKQESGIISPGEPVTLHKRADGTKPTYRLAPGLSVFIEQCNDAQCEIRAQGNEGWVPVNRVVRLQ